MDKHVVLRPVDPEVVSDYRAQKLLYCAVQQRALPVRNADRSNKSSNSGGTLP